MKNLKVKSKLIFSFMVILILFCLASAVFFYQSNRIMNNYNYFISEPYQVSNLVKDIKSDILSMRVAVKDIILSDGSRDIAALIDKIESTEKKVASEISALKSSYLGDSSDISVFEEKYKQWYTVRDKVMELMENGDKSSATRLSLDTATGYADEVLTQIDKILAYSNDKASAFYTQAHVEHILAERASIFFLVVVVLISIIIVVVLTRNITSPIHDMIHVINMVENGQPVVGIDTGGRKDELGKVAEAFNGMLDYLKTQQELHELKLSIEHQKTLEQFRITLMSIGDAVISTDIEGSITNMNPIAEKFTGWLLSEAKGKPIEDVFNIINAKTREKAENPTAKVIKNGTIMKLANHTVLISKSGECRHISDSAAPIRDDKGDLLGVVLVFRDVTEAYRKQKKIIYMSFHDKLTGLYNRTYFEEEIKRLNTTRQMPLSIIMGDINGLKLINDTFGHHAGDKYLIAVADVLKSCCRAEDIIARWGGDEFVILLPKTAIAKSQGMCSRIIKKLSLIKGFVITPSIAIGCAVQEDVQTDYQKTLKDAENNMYRHKLLESRSVRSAIVTSLDNSLSERDFITEEHAQAVVSICSDVGKRLGFTSSECDELELLARLHDIGKIAIKDSILKKPKTLDMDEWSLMKNHAEIGYRIAKSVPDLAHIAEEILSHHERWDGLGYPRGISGEDIPYNARIITVVDAYDAMTRGRPYKDAISQQDAIEELKRYAGKQFDPTVVDVFIKTLEDRQITDKAIE